MKRILFTLIIIVTVAVVSGFAQDYKVIVNENNLTETISKSDLSKIFLKKIKKWDSGTKAIPVDLSPKSSLRASFSKDIHKKSVDAIRSFWQMAVFSGQGTPPAEKNSDNDVVSYVKANPGAVGYVSINTNITGVKELKIQ